MSATSIQWTDRTWNPVRGCSRVSEGCRHCYAERLAARNLPGHRSPTTGEPFAKMRADYPQWTGRVELIPSKLDEPLRWRKPARVFVNSMSDLFHEGLPEEAIDRVFALMAFAGRHTFQVLTKRPARMNEYLASRCRSILYWDRAAKLDGRALTWEHIGRIPFPLPNVWLGVSVEDQKAADERIPLLLQTPAAVRFVSYEPALGPVDFRCVSFGGGYNVNVLMRGRPFGEAERLDWVIVGGESGPGARPLNVAWALDVAEQCKAAGVAFFYKQGGASNRCEHDAKGGHMECFPAALRIREFPA